MSPISDFYFFFKISKNKRQNRKSHLRDKRKELWTAPNFNTMQSTNHLKTIYTTKERNVLLRSGSVIFHLEFQNKRKVRRRRKQSMADALWGGFVKVRWNYFNAYPVWSLYFKLFSIYNSEKKCTYTFRFSRTGSGSRYQYHIVYFYVYAPLFAFWFSYFVFDTSLSSLFFLVLHHYLSLF